MKVVKILAVVFGAVLLLTGAGLVLGAYAVGRGDDVLQNQLATSGLTGPVDGTVIEVHGQLVTVTYRDKTGVPQVGQGSATTTQSLHVGDHASIYYSLDAPGVVVVTNLPGGSLAGIASALRTTGIVALILGALLLLAGILGLVLGKKAPAAIGAGGPPGPLPGAGPGYPYASPAPGYPTFPYPGAPQGYAPGAYPPPTWPQAYGPPPQPGTPPQPSAGDQRAMFGPEQPGPAGQPDWTPQPGPTGQPDWTPQPGPTGQPGPSHLGPSGDPR